MEPLAVIGAARGVGSEDDDGADQDRGGAARGRGALPQAGREDGGGEEGHQGRRVNRPVSHLYRVTLVVEYLGWVDLD